MAAVHTANRATIMTADGRFGPGRLRIWGNTATLREQTGTRILRTREGVTAVGAPTRAGNVNVRQVEFADGEVWEITEPRRGCGCGK